MDCSRRIRIACWLGLALALLGPGSGCVTGRHLKFPRCCTSDCYLRQRPLPPRCVGCDGSLYGYHPTYWRTWPEPCPVDPHSAGQPVQPGDEIGRGVSPAQHPPAPTMAPPPVERLLPAEPPPAEPPPAEPPPAEPPPAEPPPAEPPPAEPPPAEPPPAEPPPAEPAADSPDTVTVPSEPADKAPEPPPMESLPAAASERSSAGTSEPAADLDAALPVVVPEPAVVLEPAARPSESPPTSPAPPTVLSDSAPPPDTSLRPKVLQSVSAVWELLGRTAHSLAGL